MKNLKIKFHSVIDLITNSSTELFMDFKNSLESFKELVNEILALSGNNETCDEVFDISLTDSDECTPATFVITAKDLKYENLVTLIEKFISSIELNEYMN